MPGCRTIKAAALLGAAHLVVDLATISALLTAAGSGGFSAEWAALLVIGYDVLAFATQPLLGLAADKLGLAAQASALGCALAAAGVWLASLSPVAAVAAGALGNALFHAGGGALSLRLRPGSALEPGLFVAPGALGLFIGRQTGGTELFMPWVLTLLLAASALVAPALRMPRMPVKPAFPAVRGFGLVAAALLGTVAVRSLVGSCVGFPWAAGWPQGLLLAVAVFAGKAAGGALGGRLGWRNVAAAGLLLSAPLLAFGHTSPWASLAGLLCFNMTMAVTLAGLGKMMPGYEGFAFGLTAAAIVAGMTPAIFPAWQGAFSSAPALMALIPATAAALWWALRRLDGKPIIMNRHTGMEA